LGDVSLYFSRGGVPRKGGGILRFVASFREEKEEVIVGLLPARRVMEIVLRGLLLEEAREWEGIKRPSDRG